MSEIIRSPEIAEKKTFDLIIIGGGIQGAMLTLEATHFGLTPLLIERKDFGGATSFNSLRIIHGGFRYLQHLDFSRVRDSAGERRWFLQSFPDLVKPLPCLLPLYGRGLKRPFTLRYAQYIYNYLTRDRNIGIRSDRYIPPVRVITPSETKRIFPDVKLQGLQGGAVWHDAFVEDSQRLIIEVLRIACEHGAMVLNYLDAQQLHTVANRVTGVSAVDFETKRKFNFKSNIVINAAGPWCREIAGKFDHDDPALFHSMMAWNVLFKRKSLSTHGIALAGKGTRPHTYFLVPWKGMLLAGTGHSAWQKETRTPHPTDEQLTNFVDDINHAVPGLNLTFQDILYILPGLQSASKPGGNELAKRDVIRDHSLKGGPQGLYSVSGIKFTTSRLVAENVLNLICSKHSLPVNMNDIFCNVSLKDDSSYWDYSFDWLPHDTNWKSALLSLAAEESVVHLDDLLFRRTTLWENPERAKKMAPLVCAMLAFDTHKSIKEIEYIDTLIRDKITIK